MYQILKSIEPDLPEIKCGAGRIFVSNELQGRIFAEVDGKFVHRFITELVKNPDPDNFNNLGGNSLWPAPEGGNFAWNYPNGEDWQVQPGINSVKTSLVSADADQITVSKEITLQNAKGKSVELAIKRQVEVLPAEKLPVLPGVAVTGYKSTDSIVPLGEYKSDDVLFAPWSLEQLPGAEGIIAFGKCGDAADCINDDFYG